MGSEYSSTGTDSVTNCAPWQAACLPRVYETQLSEVLWGRFVGVGGEWGFLWRDPWVSCLPDAWAKVVIETARFWRYVHAGEPRLFSLL